MQGLRALRGMGIRSAALGGRSGRRERCFTGTRGPAARRTNEQRQNGLAQVDARKPVRQYEDDSHEESADEVQPELGKALREVRLPEVDEERAVDRPEERRAA